jgi:hypothetical protein
LYKCVSSLGRYCLWVWFGNDDTSPAIIDTVLEADTFICDDTRFAVHEGIERQVNEIQDFLAGARMPVFQLVRDIPESLDGIFQLIFEGMGNGWVL